MKPDTHNAANEAFSTLTPDHILNAIEAAGYKCDGRFLALNSYENRVYQVGIENSASVVAKFYRPGRWTNEAIIEEHLFTQTLSEHEIPVVAPLINSEGKTLLQHDSFRFALYPCLGGRTLDLDNREHLEQMGRLIGRIHALGATQPYLHRATLDVESYAIIPRAYLLQHNFIPGYLLEAYTSVTTDLIEQLNQQFDRLDGIKTIRLHGDCHPSNILWTDGGLHIVDFDDARMGPAIQDLWMFISGDRKDMTTKLADLLEGYTQFYDFNPSEIALIEALRTLRIIHYAAWLARRWDDPAFPRAFPWFNTTRYWEDHVLSLREQAALLGEPPLSWD